MRARIFLLGRFAVEIDGREVPGDAWRRRRPVDLLVALALVQGRALHREQLIDRFWPDKSLEAGANNLHRALHDLRRVSGTELARLDHGVVRLTPEAWIDVEEFEAAAGGAASEQLSHACELYRGDLLPDDPYSDGLAARRTALRQRFVDAALRLAAAHEQRAEPAARIEILRRALAIEPTLEPAHQGLMIALAQAGRQNEALRQFAQCVTALHERLGSEPTAATRKLRQAIEAGEIGAAPTAEAPSSEVAPATQRLLRSDAPRAVYGRDDALATIERFAARPAGVLLIIGEAGLGKTRLAAECLRAHARGAPALVGLGSDLGAAIPYAPFVDAWTDLRARGAAAPELDPFLELGPSSGSAQVDRLRLFRAVEAGLRNLAGSGSVMLVIEDLHQADESTLYLFHHLARASRTAPLLLVGTLREEDIHVGQPLHTLVASLGREQLAERILLERLERPALEHIARDVLGALSAEQRETIHGLAEGNPFYAEELARSLAHADQPAIVKDLLENVRERVRRLGGACERLLASAALVGSRFPFEIARAAAGLEREAALDALERALAARVIDEDEGEYRFRHALLRKALSDQLTRARRIHLHAKIAEALASNTDGGRADDAEALAFHYEAAGLLERALPHLLKAAERAQRRLGLAEAAAFLRRALDLTDAIDLADAAQHFRVLRNLGGLSLALADLEQAVRVLDAAAKIGSDAWRPSRAELASVRKLAALALIQGGQHEPAEQRLAEAIALLDGESSDELTGALYLLAQLRWHQERFAESYELAARALAEASRSGDRRGMAKGHEMLALACHALGNWREGREHELARAELGADTLDVDQAFDVHLCLWEYHLYGDSDARGLGLREEVGRALAQATRMGAPRAEALCRCFGGTLDFLSGDWERAELELREAIQLFRRVGSACGEALSLQRAGVLATARGRLDEGRALLDEGIAAGVRAAMRSHCLTRLHASLARNRLAAGDRVGAQESIGAGLSEVARHGNCATCNSLLLPEAVRVSLALEQVAEAERYSDQLDAVAARFESRLWSAMAQQARGRVLAARGARPAALEALAAAEASFSAAGYAYDAARCSLLAARLAQPSAEPTRQAEDRLRSLGSSVFED